MLNFSGQAFDAITMLKANDAWRVFKSVLEEQVLKFGNAAIEAGTPDACGYARAMRDLLWGIQAVEAGPGQGTLAARKKPDVIGKVG